MDETPGMSETLCVEATPCVSGVVASVPGGVLPSTPCVKGAPRVEETTCASEIVRVSETPRVSAPACVSGMVRVKETAHVCEQPCVSERPSVRETACVRLLYVREMTVGMREHAAASPGVNVMSWCVSLVTRGSLSARMRQRRQLRQLRDKGRVAAIVSLGTAPGWHSSEHAVRTVPGTRPPRARLQEGNPVRKRQRWMLAYPADG